MALKPAIASGNWSTAGTWGSTPNTPSIHASTTLAPTTTGILSATFTAPNTTNAILGAYINLATVPTTQNWKLTLVEGGVDTASSKTLTPADMPLTTHWVFFEFTSSYVPTSTTAGNLRFRLQSVGSNQGTVTADAAGTAFAYIAVDNRTGVPGSTDDVWIGNYNVTLEGTRTCGSGTDTATLLSSHRTVGAAVNIIKGGTLTADISASCQLTYKGHFYIGSGGQLAVASSGTPYPAAQTAKFIMDMATAGNHGFNVLPSGKALVYGALKSSTLLWKCKYVSGTGTAASPLVVDTAVDWSVGDEIKVCAGSAGATNYSETETRYIITKNSATSYVISNTKGGSENALTNTHSTDSWVLNTERNVIFETTDTAKGMYMYNQSTTAGDVTMQWVRWNNVGTNTSGKQGLFLNFTTGNVGSFDYNVFQNIIAGGPVLANSKTAETHNGWICMGGSTTSGPNGIQPSNCGSKTMNDCFSIDMQRAGYTFSSPYSCTFNRLYAVGCNKANSTSTAAFLISGGGQNTFNNCESHCNRNQGILLNNCTGVVFNNFLCGTKGVNQTTDILAATGTFNDVAFVNSNFGSATLISGYLTQSAGSEVKFHNLNDTTNKHSWYTEAGAAQATGTSLTDTTVRTPGSLGVRIAPEDATNGFVWSFNIPALAGSIVNFLGFFRKNTAFGSSVARVELWLPDSIAADATYTLTNATEEWQAVSISSPYSGTVDRLATIKIYGLTTTSGAYLYVDDLYNAGDGTTNSDKVTGLDTWDQGKPISIVSPSTIGGLVGAVWGYSTTNLTVANTTGKQLKDALTTGKFLALK